MSNKKFTHSELCDIAVKWLKRSHSAKGPGCQFAVSEIQANTSLTTEVADAFGYRCNEVGSGGWLVEVKTSRGDFLADSKKPHRINPEYGVGRYRMFMCPEGVIKSEELPKGWGLLYVNKKGHVKPQVFMDHSNYYDREQWLSEYEFLERNLEAELYIMCRLLQRFDDLEKMNQTLKEASRMSTRAWTHVERLEKSIKETSTLLLKEQAVFEFLCKKYDLDPEDVKQEYKKELYSNSILPYTKAVNLT